MTVSLNSDSTALKQNASADVLSSEYPLSDLEHREITGNALCPSVSVAGAVEESSVVDLLCVSAADYSIKALPSSSNKPTGLPVKSPSSGHSYAFSSHQIFMEGEAFYFLIRASHAHIDLNACSRVITKHALADTNNFSFHHRQEFRLYQFMIVSVWVLAEDRPSHDCFSWNVVLWFHLRS